MRFAIISQWAYMLSWALRLQDEGHEVAMWMKPEGYRTGDNMAQKFKTLDELLAWGDKNPNTIYISEGTGNGKDCDRLRKAGKFVIGDGVLNDRLEKDRAFGQEVARAVGIRIPPSTEVSGIKEAIDILSRRSEGEDWYFKPSKEVGNGEVTYGGRLGRNFERHLERLKKQHGDFPGILQQKIEGVVIDIAAWWTGKKFIGPYGILLEYKKELSGNLGPNTGSALNTIYFVDGYPRLAKELHWNRLAMYWEKLGAAPGPYDINVVIPEHGLPYYLETGPRFGYDYDLVWLPGLTRPLGETLNEWARGTLLQIPVDTHQMYHGVRVSVAPYPWESVHDKEKSALHEPIDEMPGLDYFSPYGVYKDSDGELAVGDPFGLVGIFIAADPKIDGGKRTIYKNAKKMQLANAIYRNDYGDDVKKDLAVLKGKRYEVPRGV